VGEAGNWTFEGLTTMTTTREELYQAAMELSAADRLVLASELMETVPDDLPGLSLEDPQLLDELDRRVHDGTTPIPWS
jgi:hypothetical protein